MADITALGKSDLFFMSAWYVGKLADPANANMMRENAEK